MYEPLDRRKTNVTAAMFDGPDPKTIVPIRPKRPPRRRRCS